MTISEFYTAQFYTWEFRGRGWFVADQPVELEPPFMPYFRHGYPGDTKPILDDGKRHTLVSKFLEWTKGKKTIPPTNHRLLDYDILKSIESEPSVFLTALQIKLPKERKIPPEKMKELLVMLSYAHFPISFEIIGTEKEIILQFVCDEMLTDTLETYIAAYFPDYAIIQSDAYLDNILHAELSIAVVDFGLKHEFVRPLATGKQSSLDPLLAVFAVLEKIRFDEQAGIQVLFQPVINQWSESIIRSVTMYDGTSFFKDAPEMPELAQEKAQSPMFGVTVRAFAQAKDLDDAFEMLAKLSFGVVQASRGTANELMSLATQTYDFETRVIDILERQSHRLGMLLNVDELLCLVHFPSESIVSKKLFATTRKTKEVPAIAKNKQFVLGENAHNGIGTLVTFGIEDRLKHTHIIGATGTGKSTLIANLILQDIKKDIGVVLFDPHGDLVDDIIARIPQHRIKDVVLVDPSDIEFPIGLNILQAHSDIEKEVLSSDLVAAFRKYATSWGDQMNAVFGNAILAILEHPKGGSLHDLRRLLIEKEFRNEYMKGVKDPSVQYYWLKEYPLQKTNSIGPILSRLDTFLRPKSIRNMVVQKKGIDFESLLNDNKIILLKLSQGLIGVENSFLLGSLMLSKIHQAVFRRQQQTQRNPIFIYLDEFQNFITPSIKDMLSGIRKYSVGLTLSHQDLQQLQREDGELLNSVLGNINSRIVFRVGEPDAKKLQDGFRGFDFTDLQNLGRGEAVIRIEQPQYDCSLDTIPLDTVPNAQKESNKADVRAHAREKYATAKDEVEEMLLKSMYFDTVKETKQAEKRPEKTSPAPVTEPLEKRMELVIEQPPPVEKPKKIESTSHIITADTSKEVSTHRYLQTWVKKLAEERGYTAVLEMQLPEGTGNVDVLLSKEGKTIGVEICNTTDALWEMHNIQKCITARYDTVISISGDLKQLEKIKKKCMEGIPDFDTKQIHFFTLDMLFAFLNTTTIATQPEEQIIKGYRVNVTYDSITAEEMDRKRKSVAKVVMDSLRKRKK